MNATNRGIQAIETALRAAGCDRDRDPLSVAAAFDIGVRVMPPVSTARSLATVGSAFSMHGREWVTVASADPDHARSIAVGLGLALCRRLALPPVRWTQIARAFALRFNASTAASVCVKTKAAATAA